MAIDSNITYRSAPPIKERIPMAVESVAEFAKRHNVSRQSVFNWKRKGYVVSTPGGAIDGEASDALLNARPDVYPDVYRGGAAVNRNGHGHGPLVEVPFVFNNLSVHPHARLSAALPTTNAAGESARAYSPSLNHKSLREPARLGTLYGLESVASTHNRAC